MVSNTINKVILWHFLFFLRCWTLEASANPNKVVCGGKYDAPKGVIQTPNFPGPYPTPIYCEWQIHAAPGKKIIIYFTQYYMKDSFYVTEYDHFESTSTYVGRHDLGRISWEHDLLSLAAYKPYVLIQFSVESIGNRHLRVIDHLLEVYGFNITYEIVDKAADVTKHTCSVKECSYLGNCLVNADYSKYECQCFEDFFGPQCQYGPYCDPDNNINQCTNGGRCKYFFGSLINQCECPMGYAGAYCEIPASGNGPELDKECIALKCSHLCDIDTEGKAYCECYDGYKMHQDNVTCIPIARYRMDVELELQAFIYITRDAVDHSLEEAKDAIINALKDNGLSTISKFSMKGIRNTSTTTVLEFYFYCKVSEVDHVENALVAVVKLGTVGKFRLKQSQAHYEQSPELLLAEVSNYDPNPTLRGKLLTLVCAAKGSKNITFHWYKDDYKVDTSLTQRNAWETVIPHTVHGMQLSVLNIDNVSPLDQGLFTCEVNDFGETQWGSVGVTVNNYPKVELDPMSLSIIKGQPISIKCLSPDDSWLKFLYEWFKNGVMIDPNSKREYAEDMFPTGVRLVVPSVTEHAEYTCRVTNEAGSANVSAYVYVIEENEIGQLCPRNYEGQVMWQNTSGGHFDIQRCPTEQGDYGPVNVGYARRNCKCDSITNECTWSNPNFAKCQSLVLIHIYDELGWLRYGYQKTTLKKLFDDLHNFLHPKKPVILYSGDIDMVAAILKELILHMKNFPQLVDLDTPISAKQLIELMSEMLLRSSTATDDEKEMLLVGPSIIQITSTLFTGAVDSLEYSDEPLTTSAIEMYVTRMEGISNVDPNDEPPLRHVKLRSADVDTSVNVLALTFNYLADLLSYRDLASTKVNRRHFGIVSKILSLAVYDYISNGKTQTVQVSIDHESQVNVAASNKTTCLSWSYDPSNPYSGEWTTDSCTVVKSTSKNTVCNCELPGHFVAAIVPSNTTITDEHSHYTEVNVPLLTGYSFSLVITIVSLVVYFQTFRKLDADIHVVHLSFIFTIFSTAILSIICLIHRSNIPSERAIWRILLILFYTAAFACLSFESFHILITVFDIRRIQMTKLKYVIGCWGIPVIVTGAILIVSRTVDLNHSCHMICWLSTDMKQLYAFVLAAAFMTLGFIISIGLCIWALMKWTEECRYADRQKQMKSMAKSSVLLLLLILTTSLGVDLNSPSQSAQAACHIVSHICLSLSVLITRCILDIHIRFIIGRFCFGTPQRDSENKLVNSKSKSSFHAYMKPEKANVAVSREEDNVSKYYDEVNRKKYTTERKKHLSSLLGSSSGLGEWFSGTKSISVSGSSAGSSKEGEVSTTTAPTTGDTNRDIRVNDGILLACSDASGNIDAVAFQSNRNRRRSDISNKSYSMRMDGDTKTKPRLSLRDDIGVLKPSANVRNNNRKDTDLIGETGVKKSVEKGQQKMRNPLNKESVANYPSLFQNDSRLNHSTTKEYENFSDGMTPSTLPSQSCPNQLHRIDADKTKTKQNGVLGNIDNFKTESTTYIESDAPDETSVLIHMPSDLIPTEDDDVESSCSSKLLSSSGDL